MQIIHKKISRVLLGFVLVFTITVSAYADRWRKMTFDNVIADLKELEKYCLLHDIKLEDVMWANKISVDDIKSGTTIYIPQNQIDLISIWQHIEAGNPTALLREKSQVANSKNNSQKNNSQKIPEAPIYKLEPAKTSQPPKQEFPDLTLKPNMNVPSFSMADLELKNPHTNDPQKPDSKIIQAAKSNEKSEVNNKNSDSILAAQPKKNNDIPNLMDPIIILSPNGDPSKGPMRLVISGDRVEVVQLPKSATPKKPSLADLNNSFGTPTAYLPSYPANNNFNYNNYYKQYNGVNPNLNLQALNGKMLWPVDGRVTSGFGPRGKRRHTGIDIPMPLNTPIRAARNGVVARTGNNSTMGFRGYGNFVLVDHGGGVKTLYSHCSSVGVREGQKVMQGQVIAFVGRTGRATTEHLHFEVRINDKPVNPIPYLATNPRLASRKK